MITYVGLVLLVPVVLLVVLLPPVALSIVVSQSPIALPSKTQ